MARVFEGQFIGGRSSSRRMFKDLNPADGSVWAEVPDCGRAETAAAIEAAQAAFAEW
jgi:acyl-CoA reductase-like NAD-dependent aldehyde dehydrogenase